MLEDREIVRRFLATNLQVHPAVVSYLRERQNPDLIEDILAAVPEGAVVVGPQHLPGLKTERDGTRFLGDPSLEIISGHAVPNGKGVEFTDFMHYFRDRYTRLSQMMRSRVSPLPIEALVRNSRYRQEDAGIIGMVTDVRTTAKGHRMATLEDATATVPVLFNRDRDIFSEAEKIVPDEVVGVRGKLSSDGNLFFAETLVRPDIPVNNAPYTSDRPGKAVLISDVHVGSDTFLPEAWDRFSSWLATSGAGYLLIAGDLVDGIGIYPGQEHELTIPNIYDQYNAFADMLRRLPGDLQIIAAPGNHDVVRGSEPQPALPPAFTERFPKNVTLVENPALVSLQGVRVLMYHGRSYDDLISMIPGASYTNPAPMMEEMLRRRHLACTYGMRTPIVAAKQDRLIIDPVPEILHTGHVHICGMRRYRNVLCVNAGTWQAQTKFQKQMNIQPTPARATVVDLCTLEAEVRDFSA
ncbi:MAG: DNA-directed DNA polymerase II small subunit [Methanomicrobiales archaeon]|nr:DNA-directed DNA polymerase II small subunit [Methanomicrobiales archaeon]